MKRTSPSYPRHGEIVVLIILVANIVLSSKVGHVVAHIVGPGIVEPGQSGWIFKDEDPRVESSSIQAVERASKGFYTTGYGVFFAGETVMKSSGNHEAWFGLVNLDGSLEWDAKFSSSTLTQAVAAQYNNSNAIYVAGDGPAGCSVLRLDLEGNVAWNTSFGDAGDRVEDMAIIQVDGGLAWYDNGINVIGTKADGSPFLVKLEPVNGSVVMSIQPFELGDRVMAIACDPVEPESLYVGGQDVNGDAFVLLYNTSLVGVQWRRTFTHHASGLSSIITTIQIEPTNGGVIAAGNLGQDVFVHPLQWYDGADLWPGDPELVWGSLDQEKVTDVLILGENSYKMYLCGVTRGYGVGGNDFFVLKADFFGQIEWEKVWGGMGDEFANSLTAEPGMAVFVGGTADGRGVLVNNPAGTIYPITKFFGSMTITIAFLVAVISCVIFVVTSYFFVIQKRRREKLASWMASKQKMVEDEEDANRMKISDNGEGKENARR